MGRPIQVSHPDKLCCIQNPAEPYIGVGSSTLRPARTLSGNRSGPAALRREQQEMLESKHRVNRAMGRKVRSITDVTNTALGKEEMAIRLYAARD
jgi:hypothetical protein